MALYSTYHLNAKEIDDNFVKSIKTLFKNKKVQITIVEEPDETEYLLRDKANADRLLKAVKNINSGNNLIEIDTNKLAQSNNEENII